jgi:hypothetical protein
MLQDSASREMPDAGKGLKVRTGFSAAAFIRFAGDTAAAGG